MRALLDTNVLLDFFQRRQPWVTDATALWVANEQGEYEALVCAVTLPTLFYILCRNTDATAASEAVRAVIEKCQIAGVTHAVLRAALASGFADFEDAVQHASAVAANADVIVTRDAPGFTGATLPVLAPADFRARYLTTDTNSGP